MKRIFATSILVAKSNESRSKNTKDRGNLFIMNDQLIQLHMAKPLNINLLFQKRKF